MLNNIVSRSSSKKSNFYSFSHFFQPLLLKIKFNFKVIFRIEALIKFLITLVAFFFVLVIKASPYMSGTVHPVGAKSFDAIPWKTGQIIAISTAAPYIEMATGSYYSHIGIILVESGVPFVFHSGWGTGPQKVSLDAFMAAAARFQDSNHLPMVTVEEFIKPITIEQEKALVDKLNYLTFGGPNSTPIFEYNFAMTKENPADFLNEKVNHACSEFVYIVFYNSGFVNQGVRGVGIPQQVKEMANYEDSVNSETFLQVKLSLPMVTGKSWGVSLGSIMSDIRLKVIYSTLPFGRFFSELEIVALHRWYDRLLGNNLKDQPMLKYPTNRLVDVTHEQTISNGSTAELSTLHCTPDLPEAGATVKCSILAPNFLQGYWVVNNRNMFCEKSFSCSWENVPAGDYEVKVVAEHKDGHWYESKVIKIRVK